MLRERKAVVGLSQVQEQRLQELNPTVSRLEEEIEAQRSKVQQLRFQQSQALLSEAGQLRGMSSNALNLQNAYQAQQSQQYPLPQIGVQQLIGETQEHFARRVSQIQNEVARQNPGSSGPIFGAAPGNSMLPASSLARRPPSGMMDPEPKRQRLGDPRIVVPENSGRNRFPDGSMDWNH